MNSALTENSKPLDTESIDTAVVFLIDTNLDTHPDTSLKSCRIDDFYAHLRNLLCSAKAEIYKTFDNAFLVLLKESGDLPKISENIIAMFSLVKHFNYRCSVTYGEIYVEEIDGRGEYISEAICRALKMVDIARLLKTDIIVDHATIAFCGSIEDIFFYSLPAFRSMGKPDGIQDVYMGLTDPSHLSRWHHCVDLYEIEDFKTALSEFVFFQNASAYPILQAAANCYINGILEHLERAETAIPESITGDYITKFEDEKDGHETALFRARLVDPGQQ